MTVKDFLMVATPDHDVFIKPSGSRLYYDGDRKHIPDSLLCAEVQEISVQMFSTKPEHPRRMDWDWGIWVNNIFEWDLIADAMSNEQGGFLGLDFLNALYDDLTGKDRDKYLAEIKEYIVQRKWVK